MIALFTLASCGGGSSNGFESKGRPVPSFSADSALGFVQKQVDFGPRNPNSEGHEQALNYLTEQLREYAGRDSVYQQRFEVAGYDGDTLSLTNVVAAFNVFAADRILLCAHWDTRPRTDQDPDFTKEGEPMIGANDGGSGVAVLLELARIFKDNPPPIGVDILLFDGEDYGKQGETEMYFLGSRHWSKNQPVPNYQPRFGILLDMVGGKDAVFPKERFSMSESVALVNAIWSIAGELGHETLFPDEIGRYVQDDHIVMNQELDFPTIDIIHHNLPSVDQPKTFPNFWHTSQDNMENIDPATLKVVGEVLLELIYNRM